ncbi:hypothetical protein A0H81_04305 [Grifola frondosa]|uniref:Uncharacterized protein n=1 Tax=Grifola frondosa TaxID=5627 RepID=A0A1C7MFW8_GRIFR|nr:hypothetical protein A0H81_04305 [Grifola frondosa]
MHERAISMSKGKAREGSTWQLGWWDLCHSTEGVRRPLEWTKSSIIFTAHPNQPLILARHFPSSRQFLIPSPAAIVSSPASYEPPTIISVSQTDDWLFAYFPGRGRDGVGCLWKKGAQVDSWIVKESWGFAIGAGVVTTAWTCAHREWVMSDTGTTYHLPPRGPFTPSSGPRLLLVTQSHQLHSSDTRIQIDSDTIGGPGGERVCIKAAIGLGYSESSILVAMRSQLLPSRSVNHSSFTSMEFLSLDMSNPSTPSENVFTTEWELWGEEPTIHVCEVQLDPREGIPIVTRPLSPLSPGSTHLAELSFFCQPPLRSPGSNSKGMKKDSKEASIDKGGLYLIAGFLDPGDYTSVPKSEIALFSFVKKDGPSSSNGSNWTCRLEAKRIVETKVLGFLAPSLSRNSLLAGFLDISGPLPHRKQRTKEVVIGSIEVLKLPDLSNHEGWESTNGHKRGGDECICVAISPNGTLSP